MPVNGNTFNRYKLFSDLLNITFFVNEANNFYFLNLCATLFHPGLPYFILFLTQISVVDMKTTQYIPCHSKLIRDISFHPQSHNGLMLTCAIDKKVNVTNLMTNCSLHRYVGEGGERVEGGGNCSVHRYVGEGDERVGEGRRGGGNCFVHRYVGFGGKRVGEGRRGGGGVTVLYIGRYEGKER